MQNEYSWWQYCTLKLVATCNKTKTTQFVYLFIWLDFHYLLSVTVLFVDFCRIMDTDSFSISNKDKDNYDRLFDFKFSIDYRNILATIIV